MTHKSSLNKEYMGPISVKLLSLFNTFDQRVWDKQSELALGGRVGLVLSVFTIFLYLHLHLYLCLYLYLYLESKVVIDLADFFPKHYSGDGDAAVSILCVNDRL